MAPRTFRGGSFEPILSRAAFAAKGGERIPDSVVAREHFGANESNRTKSPHAANFIVAVECAAHTAAPIA
jgi:hypothetical protein